MNPGVYFTNASKIEEDNAYQSTLRKFITGSSSNAYKGATFGFTDCTDQCNSGASYTSDAFANGNNQFTGGYCGFSAFQSGFKNEGAEWAACDITHDVDAGNDGDFGLYPCDSNGKCGFVWPTYNTTSSTYYNSDTLTALNLSRTQTDSSAASTYCCPGFTVLSSFSTGTSPVTGKNYINGRTITDGVFKNTSEFCPEGTTLFATRKAASFCRPIFTQPLKAIVGGSPLLLEFSLSTKSNSPPSGWATNTSHIFNFSVKSMSYSGNPGATHLIKSDKFPVFSSPTTSTSFAFLTFDDYIPFYRSTTSQKTGTGTKTISVGIKNWGTSSTSYDYKVPTQFKLESYQTFKEITAKDIIGNPVHKTGFTYAQFTDSKGAILVKPMLDFIYNPFHPLYTTYDVGIGSLREDGVDSDGTYFKAQEGAQGNDAFDFDNCQVNDVAFSSAKAEGRTGGDNYLTGVRRTYGFLGNKITISKNWTVSQFMAIASRRWTENKKAFSQNITLTRLPKTAVFLPQSSTDWPDSKSGGNLSPTARVQMGPFASGVFESWCNESYFNVSYSVTNKFGKMYDSGTSSSYEFSQTCSFAQPVSPQGKMSFSDGVSTQTTSTSFLWPNAESEFELKTNSFTVVPANPYGGLGSTPVVSPIVLGPLCSATLGPMKVKFQY